MVSADVTVAIAAAVAAQATTAKSAYVTRGESAINVADYGATGDGITDDTAAIQKAIDASPALGTVIYFPAGTYVISSTLWLRIGVSLQGCGALSSVIQQTSLSSSAVTLNNIAEAHTVISELGFTGPGGGTGDGLHLDRSTSGDNQIGLNVRNVFIQKFGGHGVFATGAIASTFERVICTDVGGDGFHIEKVDANAGTTSTSFINCYANNPAGDGYYINAATISGYTSFLSCAADNAQIGYHLVGVYVAGLYSCGAEVSVVASYKIEHSYHVNVTTCLSAACSGVDFWLVSARNICITGTYASSAQTGHTAGLLVDANSHALIFGHENTSSVEAAGGNQFLGTVVELSENPAEGLTFNNDVSIFRKDYVADVGPGTPPALYSSDNLDFPIGIGPRYKKGVTGVGTASTDGLIGEATLVAGQVTVPCKSVTALSLIFLQRHGPAGTELGLLNYYARVAGVSFSVQSVRPLQSVTNVSGGNGTPVVPTFSGGTAAVVTGDTSTFSFFIVNPAP